MLSEGRVCIQNISVKFLAFLCLIPGVQAEQWDTLFQNLVSADPSVSEAARARAFNTVIPQLLSEDAATLSKDVIGIVTQFKGSSDDPIRLQASGLLATVAALRMGVANIQPAIPALTEQMHDPNERIRFNAVHAMSNLKPFIPRKAATDLIDALGATSEKIVREAAHGVARLAVSSPEAVNAMNSLLSSTRDTHTKQVVIHSIAEQHLKAPQLTQKLGELLQDQDRDVEKQSLLAVPCLGA